MAKIEDCLTYLDHYLNFAHPTETQKVIRDSFSGLEGRWKDKDYHSNEFRLEIVNLANSLGLRFNMISNTPEFEEARSRDNGLSSTLSDLNNRVTFGIQTQASEISEEQWKQGKRGTLLIQYRILASRYSQFKESLQEIIKLN